MKQKKKFQNHVMNLSLSLLVELGPAVEYTVKAKKQSVGQIKSNYKKKPLIRHKFFQRFFVDLIAESV